MNIMQRTSWSACLLAPALLALPACYDSASEWGSTGGYGEQPACTDWYTYDPDWHRCHWNEPVSWCNAPPDFSDSGASYGSTADAGAAAADDGGGSLAVSGDSGTGSSATGDSGTGGGMTGDSASGLTADSGMGGGGTGDSGTVATMDSSASSDGAGGNTGNTSDAGSTSDGPQPIACTLGATCPAGDSCVGGSCQPCSGVCTCSRDDDCAGGQICDHAGGQCAMPPPVCTALATEADCVARADCEPIYGGMNCTNGAGVACHTGEANCTCASYSFAVCKSR